MPKRAHHYRLRLEHLAPAAPEQPLHAPREIEFDNHDDIFSIIERMKAASFLPSRARRPSSPLG